MRENTIDVMEHTHADPKKGPPPRSFLDTVLARLLALGLAAVLAIGLVAGLGDRVMALVSDEEVEPTGGAEIVLDPGVARCMEQRGGDVDQLLADGVITDVQHADFRQRAMQMCQDGVQTAPRV